MADERLVPVEGELRVTTSPLQVYTMDQINSTMIIMPQIVLLITARLKFPNNLYDIVHIIALQEFVWCYAKNLYMFTQLL